MSPSSAPQTPSSSSFATPPSAAPSTALFTFPPLHSFPPFYTLQPNLTTRASQLSSWSSLLLSYCSHNRIFRLSTSHPIFHNESLNRRLAPDDVKVLFSYMKEKGRAEFVNLSSAPAKSRASGWIPGRAGAEEEGPKEEVYVFWKTRDEWASEMVEWVEETGQKGTVLTVYEMTEGDQSKGKSWEGMPRDVVRRVLDIVVKRGRGVMFGEEEGLGVKFY